MKLASLKDGRDGRLVVVTGDLAWCAPADRIAPTLQAALDEWDRYEPDPARTANVSLLHVGDVLLNRVGKGVLAEQSWWRYGRELRRRRA